MTHLLKLCNSEVNIFIETLKMVINRVKPLFAHSYPKKLKIPLKRQCIDLLKWLRPKINSNRYGLLRQSAKLL